MKVTVVVPVFNEAQYLGAQLNALAAQDFAGEWEVAIADNGSTDGTRAIALDWSNRLPLRVIDASERRGCGAAKNIGVQATNGDALLFCDGDDVVAPAWLAAHASALEGAAISAGAMLQFRTEPRVIRRVPSEPPTLLGWLPYAQGANSAVRRDVYEAIGGFNEANPAAEDVEFSWRAQLAGYSFTYSPEAIVHKRARAAARATFRQYYRYGKSDVDMFAWFREHGAARAPASSLTKTYAGLIARVPALRSPQVRERWLRQCGRRCGRLVASVERRTFFP